MIIEDDMELYLQSSYYIDWKNEKIIQKADEIRAISAGEINLIENTYHFVRDEIKHSWDVQDKRVTIKATDVLREKVGICFAKANLLAGLLRANGIPSGICYQRLTLGDAPESGYCIHALNAVYITSLRKWIRLDARGNNDNVQAEMDIEREKLAFNIRTEFEEIDYPNVYAEPLKMTMEVIENSNNALEMYLHSLPDRLI